MKYLSYKTLGDLKRCPGFETKCGEWHERSHRYCRFCHARYMRKWRLSHPLSEIQRLRNNARRYASVYQERGLLIPQPCEVCASPDVEKHHDDYSKPLEVRWLCRQHHLGHHQEGARNGQDS